MTVRGTSRTISARPRGSRPGWLLRSDRGLQRHRMYNINFHTVLKYNPILIYLFIYLFIYFIYLFNYYLCIIYLLLFIYLFILFIYSDIYLFRYLFLNYLFIYYLFIVSSIYLLIVKSTFVRIHF